MIANPLPYLWRGRTYKTVLGLQQALRAAYPAREVAFEAAAVKVRALGNTFTFARTFTAGVCVIEDNPAPIDIRRKA